MIQGSMTINGRTVLQKIKNSFTQMDDFTLKYCNEMRVRKIRHTMIYPVIGLVILAFALNGISEALHKDWIINLWLIVVPFVTTFVGTKFMTWVTFTIYKYFNKRLIPTFFYWTFSVIFGLLISGLVFFIGMYVFIIVLLIVVGITLLLGSADKRYYY